MSCSSSHHHQAANALKVLASSQKAKAAELQTLLHSLPEPVAALAPESGALAPGHLVIANTAKYSAQTVNDFVRSHAPDTNYDPHEGDELSASEMARAMGDDLSASRASAEKQLISELW